MQISCLGIEHSDVTTLTLGCDASSCLQVCEPIDMHIPHVLRCVHSRSWSTATSSLLTGSLDRLMSQRLTFRIDFSKGRMSSYSRLGDTSAKTHQLLTGLFPAFL